MKVSRDWICELVPRLALPSRDREGAFFAAAFGNCKFSERQ